MSIIFTDSNPAGPFSTFQVKQPQFKFAKLTNANFGTTAVNTLVMMLPADASIVSISYWNKTKLAGNSISAATVSVGSTSGGTELVNGFDVFTTVGTTARFSPILGILQPYQVPLGGEIPVYISGSATTGNPTSGEIYLIVEYVR